MLNAFPWRAPFSSAPVLRYSDDSRWLHRSFIKRSLNIHRWNGTLCLSAPPLVPVFLETPWCWPRVSHSSFRVSLMLITKAGPITVCDSAWEISTPILSVVGGCHCWLLALYGSAKSYLSLCFIAFLVPGLFTVMPSSPQNAGWAVTRSSLVQRHPLQNAWAGTWCLWPGTVNCREQELTVGAHHLMWNLL